MDDLIAKLRAWKSRDFHRDRQLSDEVLIAGGWRCEPDEAWEGGVRWSWGTNPEVKGAALPSAAPRPRPTACVG